MSFLRKAFKREGGEKAEAATKSKIDHTEARQNEEKRTEHQATSSLSNQTLAPRNSATSSSTQQKRPTFGVEGDKSVSYLMHTLVEAISICAQGTKQINEFLGQLIIYIKDFREFVSTHTASKNLLKTAYREYTQKAQHLELSLKSLQDLIKAEEAFHQRCLEFVAKYNGLHQAIQNAVKESNTRITDKTCLINKYHPDGTLALDNQGKEIFVEFTLSAETFKEALGKYQATQTLWKFIEDSEFEKTGYAKDKFIDKDGNLVLHQQNLAARADLKMAMDNIEKSISRQLELFNKHKAAKEKFEEAKLARAHTTFAPLANPITASAPTDTNVMSVSPTRS